jgi:hypothetical protein
MDLAAERGQSQAARTLLNQADLGQADAEQVKGKDKNCSAGGNVSPLQPVHLAQVLEKRPDPIEHF